MTLSDHTMDVPVINVLITSFPGLSLPKTLLLPLTVSTTITELQEQLQDRIPPATGRLILTTTRNKQLPRHSSTPISELLINPEDAFLSLRLSAPLCGGKGGFGSQLRAAGGRMSSKKKKNQGDNNGSSRNLDGRRLRTVTEAKALAEYLAIKPDMEKKEKEARRRRWEQIVELAERREEEIRTESKGKVDGKWVEDKEEANERTRDAVLVALQSGNYKDNLHDPNSSSSPKSMNGGTQNAMVSSGSSKTTTPTSDIEEAGPATARTFFGFDDDDDEFMSDESDDVVDDKPIDSHKKAALMETRTSPSTREVKVKKGKGSRKGKQKEMSES